jgi:hypothetical protein
MEPSHLQLSYLNNIDDENSKRGEYERKTGELEKGGGRRLSWRTPDLFHASFDFHSSSILNASLGSFASLIVLSE